MARRRRPRWSAIVPVATAGMLGAGISGNDRIELAELAPSRAERPLAHDWQLREGKHWQIVSTSVETTGVADAAEGTTGACPQGMVEVAGRMKGDRSGDVDSLDRLQDEACTDWIEREFPERCARYDRSRWLALSGDLATEPLRFCIDRFEYPNLRGAYPWIFVTWYDAKEICAAAGKRLCTEAEWTFACEGEEATPYPYGYERDPGACVIDMPWIAVDESALDARTETRVLSEIDRLWQGESSGSRPRCRSPFGLYDMTGNIDEWTTSVRPGERPSILKGGYWGPVRARCRPSTRVHGEDFAFYQQGFRCCANAPPP